MSDQRQLKPTSQTKDMLEKLRTSLGQLNETVKPLLPSHLTVQSFQAAFYSVFAREPNLLECTRQSIAQCYRTLADLGLEANSPLGEAYLVAYRNRQKQTMELQVIPGYQGLLKLARQSGEISRISARPVYSNDFFEVILGTEERLTHRPCLDKDRGELVCFYMIAVMKDGTVQHEVMSKHEVDRIRSMSKAPDSPAWSKHYDEMGRKTVVRRGSKYLPKSSRLAVALELQAKAEIGEFTEGYEVDGTTVIVTADGAQEAPESPHETRTEGLVQKLKRGRGRPPGSKNKPKEPPVVEVEAAVQDDEPAEPGMKSEEEATWEE